MIRAFRALPLAILAALAVPASASAASLPVKVTVSGKQQSTYNYPKTYGYKDCYNHHWSEMNGRRAFEFSTSSRGRLITVPGNLVIFMWDVDYKAGGAFLDRNASITRSWDGLRGADPGECGGGRPVEVLRGDGCGSRNVPHDIDLSVERGRVTVSAADASKKPQGTCATSFTTCLGQDPLAKRFADLPMKRLRKRKAVEMTTSDRCGAQKDGATLGGSMNWRVRIEPTGRWARGS